MRGCDTFEGIELAPTLLGRPLYNALIALGEEKQGVLTRVQFPCKMSIRLAFCLSCGAFGGPSADSAPTLSLTVADFSVARSIGELLDPVNLRGTFKLEQRPAAPSSLHAWRQAVIRQVYVYGLVYGKAHKPQRLAAMEGLVALALTQPDLWTFRRVQDVWEELCWRYN